MSTIVLDVEGVFFKTRISTLISVKGSFFDNIFTQDWRSQLDKSGNLFIDRDSTVFPVILNFLRDGSTIPLPRDDYTLERILQEARFFRLFQLCDMVEKIISYSQLPLMKKSVKHKVQKNNGMTEKENLRATPTLATTPTPVLAEYSRRLSADTLPIPIKKSSLDKKKKMPESISLPRNFAHIAHVGWNGRGIIFQKHLLDQEQTVRAIIDAAGEADITPIYNVVSGDDSAFGSHSVEVILAGPHMNVKEETRSRDFYSKPQKKMPPKLPAKPKDLVPRPSSARS